MVLRIAKWLGIGLATLVGGAVAVGVAARFGDGPLGPFPGGAMSGTSVSEPVSDWSFLAARDTVELQVSPDAPRSVTTAIIVHEAQALCTSRVLRLRKARFGLSAPAPKEAALASASNGHPRGTHAAGVGGGGRVAVGGFRRVAGDRVMPYHIFRLDEGEWRRKA